MATITQTPSGSSAGENVSSVVGLLVQLCIGSLGNNVPTQDTLVALEGMLSLKDQHNIFMMDWLQENYWMNIFVPCLKVTAKFMIV